MTTPLNSLYSENKDNYFQSQKKIVLEYLRNHVATASMIAKATGIPHKNICRHKCNLENAGLLKELYKAPCKETGYGASYLTTNSKLFPKASEWLYKNKTEG